MRSHPENPWIHIGQCPFCVDGLCGIRCCCDPQGTQHLYALCDECGTAWTRPNTDTEKTFPDLDQPLCPVCGRSLFGDHARWALAEDLANHGDWDEVAIFEVPSDDCTGDDNPASTAPEENDLAYGQDEPKPGC